MRPLVAAYTVGALIQLTLVQGLGANAPRVLGNAWWVAWLVGAVWAGVVGTVGVGTARRNQLFSLCAGVAITAMGLGELSPVTIHLALPLCAVLLAVALAAVLSKLPERLELALAGHWVPWACGLITSGWFFTVSYLRHAWFGSGCKDMGLFLQSVWLISRGHSPENTVMGMNAFADHMEFIDFLFAPLLWVWPDAGAMLLGQALCAGMGAVPIFRMARRHWGSPTGGLLAAAAFFFAHQVISGIMFDWNPTTVSIGFFAWAMEAATEKKWRKMGVFLVLIGLCKENLLLYECGFGLWLALIHAPRKVWISTLLAPAVAFVVEVKLIFPQFREGGFRHFYFQELGTDLVDVAINVLKSPARAFTQMFNPAQKVNGLLLPLTATAFGVLFYPGLLLPMLPGMLERFGSTFQNSWWGHHYGGPYQALALCGAVLGGAKVQQWLRGRAGEHVSRPVLRGISVFPGCVLLVGSLLVSFSGPWGPIDLFVLHKPYHPSETDRVTMNAAVKSVPPDVSVAAQNYLLPHLAARKRIFMLEHAREADWVVMTPTSNPWPYDLRFNDKLAHDLLNEGWRVHFCEGNSFVLARGDGQNSPCAVLGR